MLVLDRLTSKAAEAEALDRVAHGIEKVIHPVVGAPGVRSVLRGEWLGHPLHPMMIVVPMGSWISAHVLDLTMGQRGAAASRKLVGMGIASAVPTAAAGLSDWQTNTRTPEDRRVGLTHALSNSVAVAFYTASWAARRSGLYKRGVALSLVGATAMGVGGYIGGHLSYRLGVGVDSKALQREMTKDQQSDR